MEDKPKPVRSDDTKRKLNEIKKKIEKKVFDEFEKDDFEELGSMFENFKVDTESIPRKVVEEEDEGQNDNNNQPAKSEDEMDVEKPKKLKFDYIHSIILLDKLRIKNPPCLPYHELAPSSDSLFKMHLSYLLQFPIIENLFMTPLVIPLFWMKNPDRWKAKMSFSEIIYELDRLNHAFLHSEIANSNTIYAKGVLSSINKKNVKSQQVQTLVSDLLRNMDKIHFPEPTKKTQLLDLLKNVFQKGKVVKNLGLAYNTFSYIPDLGQGNNLKIKHKHSVEAFEYQFHQYRSEFLTLIKNTNQQLLDDMITSQEYSDRILKLQSNFITMYSLFMVNVLTEASSSEFDPEDFKKLTSTTSKDGVLDFIAKGFPVDVSDPNEIECGSHEILANERANLILKRKIFKTDLIDINRKKLIISTLGLHNQTLDSEVLKYMVSEMSDSDISNLSKKYEQGLREFSSYSVGLKELEDENQKNDTLYSAVNQRVTNFNRNITSDRPVLELMQ